MFEIMRWVGLVFFWMSLVLNVVCIGLNIEARKRANEAHKVYRMLIALIFSPDEEPK